MRIIASRLPGLTNAPYSEVTVRLALKSAADSEEVFAADVREAKWETAIEVGERDGALTFRGPAVQGRPPEQFFYLTWVGREGPHAPAMFRRAKLRLDGVPSSVWKKALKAGLLVARLELTARDGTPVCASVFPPAIRWTSD